MNEPAAIAATPKTPYYAVVFTSLRTPGDNEAYGVTAERMVELAADQPGFLGVESARGENGLGITVSYWQDLAAIRHWRQHAEHAIAQRQGKHKWYAAYSLRICLVEREATFPPGGAMA